MGLFSSVEVVGFTKVETAVKGTFIIRQEMETSYLFNFRPIKTHECVVKEQAHYDDFPLGNRKFTSEEADKFVEEEGEKRIGVWLK